MKELFMLIRDRLLLNEPMVLATVIKSSGSTPRGAGARMLVGKGTHGEAIRLWGTIGGGLPEHLAIEEAGSLVSEHAANPAFSFRKYALHPNGAAELGARCGGEVSVFFRSMDLREPGLLDLVEK
ncbi:MAG: XdhC family protein, partial [Treponema sp.]|nr:XdhC family protein [Treponema sp.]